MFISRLRFFLDYCIVVPTSLQRSSDLFGMHARAMALRSWQEMLQTYSWMTVDSTHCMTRAVNFWGSGFFSKPSPLYPPVLQHPYAGHWVRVDHRCAAQLCSLRKRKLVQEINALVSTVLSFVGCATEATRVSSNVPVYPLNITNMKNELLFLQVVWAAYI